MAHRRNCCGKLGQAGSNRNSRPANNDFRNVHRARNRNASVDGEHSSDQQTDDADYEKSEVAKRTLVLVRFTVGLSGGLGRWATVSRGVMRSVSAHGQG
jgi:hypothetical protein